MFGVCASGCLLPQENQLLNPLPPRQNRPPRILEDQVTPTRFITTNNGPDCRIVFSFRVEDPDVDDLLFTNWYIDYQSNPAPVKEDSIQPSGGKAVRDTSAELRIDFQVDNPLRADGYHLVEGLVSDGSLVNRTPLPRPLEQGGTTYAVTYAWMVKVENGSCNR